MTDERSDIYSVGVMLYEMLTGRKLLHRRKYLWRIALKHMQEDPVPPREIMPSIPEALEEIVMHAMERDPARRYQSAAEMIKDIDTFKLNPSVVFGYKNSPVPIPVADNNNKYFDDEHSENYDDDEEYEDDDEENDDEEEEEEKKRSYVVPILLAVTVAVVIIAAFVIVGVVFKSFSGSNGMHTGTVTLPNFVGKNIVQVEQDYKISLNLISPKSIMTSMTRE